MNLKLIIILLTVNNIVAFNVVNHKSDKKFTTVFANIAKRGLFSPAVEKTKDIIGEQKLTQ